MRYEEWTVELRVLVEGATVERRWAFGLDTVRRLTNAEALDALWDGELTEAAWGALRTAVAAARDVEPTTGASVATVIDRLLGTVDEGVLSDGDMDPELLAVIEVVSSWSSYLGDGSAENLARLATVAFERIDYEESVDLDDVLATVDIAEEWNRTRRLLS
ncbi:hypothetical protein [Stackebrandtia soli]|uniref:hypothetical protein n=1 Tax=Stackebrandtia soli TaxID=1892856 RepID=UPI0039E93153